MGSYRVLSPVGFTRNNEAVTAWVGAVVEVDDDQAKELVKDGKLEPVKESKPASKVKAES